MPGWSATSTTSDAARNGKGVPSTHFDVKSATPTSGRRPVHLTSHPRRRLTTDLSIGLLVGFCIGILTGVVVVKATVNECVTASSSASPSPVVACNDTEVLCMVAEDSRQQVRLGPPRATTNASERMPNAKSPAHRNVGGTRTHS